MKRIRISLAAIAMTLTMLASGTSAWAGPQWCEEDPEFLVNGAVVDVTTVFAGQYASKIHGSVHFDLQVPSNATALVIKLPGTVPVTASISRTLPAYHGLLRVPVIVTVSMKSSEKFPTFTRVTGLTNSIASGYDGDSQNGTRVRFSMLGLGL
jgi:hypothetical protein